MNHWQNSFIFSQHPYSFLLVLIFSIPCWIWNWFLCKFDRNWITKSLIWSFSVFKQSNKKKANWYFHKCPLSKNKYGWVIELIVIVASRFTYRYWPSPIKFKFSHLCWSSTLLIESNENENLCSPYFNISIVCN